MAFLSAPEVAWLYSGVTKTKASSPLYRMSLNLSGTLPMGGSTIRHFFERGKNLQTSLAGNFNHQVCAL